MCFFQNDLTLMSDTAKSSDLCPLRREKVPINMKRTIPTALTGLSTFLKKCRLNDFLSYLRSYSIDVEMIEFEEYSISFTLSNIPESINRTVLNTIIYEFIKPIAKTFALIALPKSVSAISFDSFQDLFGEY